MSVHNHDEELMNRFGRKSERQIMSPNLKDRGNCERSDLQKSVTFKTFCEELNQCFETPCRSLNTLNEFYVEYKDGFYNGTVSEWAKFFFCEHEPPFNLK